MTDEERGEARENTHMRAALVAERMITEMLRKELARVRAERDRNEDLLIEALRETSR